ncbi:SF1B family DNA helicase RecD2 [Pseudomonas aeruginosa]
MDKPVTLNGIVSRIHHRGENDFVIFELKEGGTRYNHTVQGTSPDVGEGDVVECEGSWITYNGGPRFKAKAIIPQVPTTEEAIFNYISSGRVKGIKKVMAAKLIDHFGKHLLEVIENEPERLREVKGFGKVLVQNLIDGLRDEIGNRSILVFLHGIGLTRRYVTRIYEAFGFSAVAKITENPYLLCEKISGIGFALADKVGSKVGIPADAPVRVNAGMQYALKNACSASGSTGIPEGELIREARKLLSGAGAIPLEALKAGVRSVLESGYAKELDVEYAPPSQSGTSVPVIHRMIFPADLYEAEVTIARSIIRLNRMRGEVKVENELLDECIAHCANTLGVSLHENQHEAVKMALVSPISIITGGPGTGKTTILRVMIECFRYIMNAVDEHFLLCAPTGRAAERMSESTGLQTSTIHSALGYNPDEDGCFYNEENQLPHRFIVVDESSMIDTELASWLLQSIGTGTRLIMVGDFDQLPSVGPGRVLYDLIMSEMITVTRLTKIWRTAENSRINIIADGIKKSEMPDISNVKDSDFYFVRRETDADIAMEICSLVPRLAAHYKLDPFEDIQVLTPMRKTDVGIHALNAALQKQLNGANLGSGVTTYQEDHKVEFCRGDKVIHMRNNKALGVKNGTTGRIVDASWKTKTVTVRYDEKRLVEYGEGLLDELRLAYAMTVHKSQGSEYRIVIIPMSMSHVRMLYNTLLYTGVTRGKGVVVPVGRPIAFRTAVENKRDENRITGLRKHLELAQAA